MKILCGYSVTGASFDDIGKLIKTYMFYINYNVLGFVVGSIF